MVQTDQSHLADSPQKRFLLGVGCQKGGTTWLHNYLNSHPACDLGAMKEYHVFDTISIHADSAFSARTAQTISRLSGMPRKALDRGSRRDLDRALLRKSFIDEPSSYFDYFKNLAAKENVALVGDITPSYSGLSHSTLSEIREQLESVGFKVRVVFLMRDPVERCFSAVRMNLRRRAETGRRVRTGEIELLKKKYSEADYEIRTRYETTIRNLDLAFSTDQVYYGFFERMFAEDEIKRLTSFLGINYLTPNLGERINYSPQKEAIPSEVVTEVRNHYAETYRFCMSRFGEPLIRSIWPNANGLPPAAN